MRMKQLFTILLMLLLVGTVKSQQKDSVTTADYIHAQKYLYSARNLVDNMRIYPNWINGDKFWYRYEQGKDKKFYLVDAAKGKKRPAFDQAQLAASLSEAAGKDYSANDLPFNSFDFTTDMDSITFQVKDQFWKVSLENYTSQKITPDSESENIKWTEVVSPDGKKAAFIRDYNLWVRNLETGEEKQLTTDGVKNYGYATDNAGWTHSEAAILRWSPDSKKIATFQQDQRNVGEMYLVTTNVGHPELKAWKYPLPGDSIVIMIERVIIEVDTPKVIRLQMPPDYHRGTLSDDISSSGTFDDVDWSTDGSHLAFVSTSRDHKIEQFRIADTHTGEIREVFTEKVPTQYESGQGEINWRYLPATNEIIWYSEKDNWGHLYLYDAKSGKLKHQITKGNFVVTRLMHVDEVNRKVYFMTTGLDPVNPYFEHFCSVGYDGKDFKDLTPETGNHLINYKDHPEYFMDNYSQPDVPAVFTVRNNNGELIMKLGETDISHLKKELNWKPPTVFSVKAHDGVTDIYGLMFTPTDIDSGHKYPIVNYIYPGPQGGSVGRWSFTPTRGDHQALAELGFVVIAIEGTCNPHRSKSYHDMCYGNMGINTLPDQVGGIRQLASRYAFLDTSRIGIWGHSGGGFATADAMFTYPDFYKVGIAESGNHDNRNYEDDWGERYIGLLEEYPDGSDNYQHQANQMHAENLKGNLLLVHGLMDDNVPPYNTFLVVEALIKANKDFDLLVFPSAHHGYGRSSLYMMRKRWDYFVKNLMGAVPPKEFKMSFR